MIRETHARVAEAVSGQNAFRYVAEIAQRHRIQSSPGFRAAAALVADELTRAGLAVDTLRFPADGRTFTWSSLVPQEWRLRSAELRLVAPAGEARVLASTLDHPLSVIQRSTPTPPEGVEAEVVALDGGADPRDYDGVEVRGKFVLTDRAQQTVHRLAVVERGAVGVIFDGMAEIPGLRPKGDLPDALQYTSYWWTPVDTRGFGFVLSPREGARLRATCRRGSVVVRGRVDAEFVDGEMEAVTATLPGLTADEEVVILTHLCHPQPSANDNASGVGAVLEAARALAAAVAAGTLPRPRRTIRFLFPAEMMGTYAYLAGDPARTARAVAALNLDMVGENQDLCGSTLTVERPALSTPGWVADVLERLVEDEARGYPAAPDRRQAARFRHTSAPFNGGSDHYILSDPTVGVPCPMLIQWPDRFYHTSADMLDKVDPVQLARAARLAATYAHFLADAGPAEVGWIAAESVSRWTRRALDLAQEAVTAGAGHAALEQRLAFLADAARGSLADLRRLDAATVETQQPAWERQVKVSTQFAVEHARMRHTAGEPSNTPRLFEHADFDRVPRRTVPGPISAHGLHAHLDEVDRAELHALGQRGGRRAGLDQTLAVYWVDGRRTCREVAACVEAETGEPVDRVALHAYFRLLARAGYLAGLADSRPAD